MFTCMEPRCNTPLSSINVTNILSSESAVKLNEFRVNNYIKL